MNVNDIMRLKQEKKNAQIFNELKLKDIYHIPRLLHRIKPINFNHYHTLKNIPSFQATYTSSHSSLNNQHIQSFKKRNNLNPFSFRIQSMPSSPLSSQRTLKKSFPPNGKDNPQFQVNKTNHYNTKNSQEVQSLFYSKEEHGMPLTNDIIKENTPHHSHTHSELKDFKAQLAFFNQTKSTETIPTANLLYLQKPYLKGTFQPVSINNSENDFAYDSQKNNKYESYLNSKLHQHHPIVKKKNPASLSVVSPILFKPQEKETPKTLIQQKHLERLHSPRMHQLKILKDQPIIPHSAHHGSIPNSPLPFKRSLAFSSKPNSPILLKKKSVHQSWASLKTTKKLKMGVKGKQVPTREKKTRNQGQFLHIRNEVARNAGNRITGNAQTLSMNKRDEKDSDKENQMHRKSSQTESNDSQQSNENEDEINHQIISNSMQLHHSNAQHNDSQSSHGKQDEINSKKEESEIDPNNKKKKSQKDAMNIDLNVRMFNLDKNAINNIRCTSAKDLGMIFKEIHETAYFDDLKGISKGNEFAEFFPQYRARQRNGICKAHGSEDSTNKIQKLYRNKSEVHFNLVEDQPKSPSAKKMSNFEKFLREQKKRKKMYSQNRDERSTASIIFEELNKYKSEKALIIGNRYYSQNFLQNKDNVLSKATRKKFTLADLWADKKKHSSRKNFNQQTPKGASKTAPSNAGAVE